MKPGSTAENICEDQTSTELSGLTTESLIVLDSQGGAIKLTSSKRTNAAFSHISMYIGIYEIAMRIESPPSEFTSAAADTSSGSSPA